MTSAPLVSVRVTRRRSRRCRGAHACSRQVGMTRCWRHCWWKRWRHADGFVVELNVAARRARAAAVVTELARSASLADDDALRRTVLLAIVTFALAQCVATELVGSEEPAEIVCEECAQAGWHFDGGENVLIARHDAAQRLTAEELKRRLERARFDDLHWRARCRRWHHRVNYLSLQPVTLLSCNIYGYIFACDTVDSCLKKCTHGKFRKLNWLVWKMKLRPLLP